MEYHAESVRGTTKSYDSRELAYMKLALKQAEKAVQVGEVPVGCVFVYVPEDKIIAEAHNATNQQKNATRHCEFVAIDQILQENGNSTDIFENCELYVTVEPCVMCAAALRNIGIGKVYYGCGNPRFGGNGSVYSLHQIPDEYNYQSIGGLYEAEAIRLLKHFYSMGNPSAPEQKRARELKQPISSTPLQENSSSEIPSVKPAGSQTYQQQIMTDINDSRV